MAEARGKGQGQGQAGQEARGKAEARGKRQGRDWIALALAVVAGIVASVGLLMVISAGFALSFDAISAVAVASHIVIGKAWMMPVSIDGAMLVASVHFVIARRGGGKGWYPLTVVVVGTLISVACNGLHATGDKGLELDLDERARFLVSTVPALMLALSVHMLVELLVQVMGKPAHATHASHATPIDEVEQVEAPAPLLPPAPVAPVASLALPLPALSPVREVEATAPEATPVVEAIPSPEARPARATVAARAPRQTTTARVEAKDDLASKRSEHEANLVGLRALALEVGKVPGRQLVKDTLHIRSESADAALRALRAEIDAGSFTITATTQESAQ